MAVGIFGQSGPALCDGIFFADYGNFAISGIVRKIRKTGRDSGDGEFSRHNLLGGLAHVPCSHNIIFHINFRIYLIDCSFDYFRAKNDNKSTDSKTELHWVSDFYSEQDDLSVCVFIHAILKLMDLLCDVVCIFRVAVDFVQCGATLL
jgi:hypothetical protein